MSRFAPEDLEPAERRTHELLASVPPRALPLGFRDAVMRQVASRRTAWEWIVAAALALPSLGFLAYQFATHGDEFAGALNNVTAAASADTAEAFFFIDGATVLALALVGIASLIAAHAAIVAPSREVAR
ncbi:MAG TPA: hypothetical protein VIN63_01090 [Candidatus Limnocylindria bacterium]|jgi:hypothetical protein